MNDFAEWLDKKINDPKNKITQLTLARLFGVNPSTVSFWVNGKTFPNEEQVKKLAIYFKVEESSLLQLMGKMGGIHAYTPEVAALMQFVDQQLAEIDDPKVKEIAIERLKHDLTALTDMIERMADLFGDKE